jgi:hypothetical protein
MHPLRLGVLAAAWCLAAGAQTHVYVGRISSRSAVLAWGTTEGHNTIGRASTPAGPAEVTVDGRAVPVDAARNWVEVPVEPDRRYSYRVVLRGKPIAEGYFRSYPEAAERLCFLVIGDFGTGEPEQAALGRAMELRLASQEKVGCPVRFVLTTGDNIYGRRRFLFGRTDTGDSDVHWESRFFAPYAAVLRSTPFYPSVGNHDGSESEREGDLAVYLDNFFFPGETQAGGRYYRFSFGELAEFFALDTSANLPALGIQTASTQFRWVEEALQKSRARWKLPFYHHPRYCGGPGHGSRDDLAPLIALFQRYGVRAAFNGHEHNWQPIEEKTAAGGTFYHIISGAGGELRTGRPQRNLDSGKARVVDWAPRIHFALVDLDRTRMTVTPVGVDNQPVATPLTVNLP